MRAECGISCLRQDARVSCGGTTFGNRTKKNFRVESMRLNLAVTTRAHGAHARAWCVAALWALSPLALAASVPWTPSTSARSAIEVLVDDGGLPLTVSQWPLPRDAVQRALDTLPAELPPALDAARALVRAELRAQQASRIGLTLRERKDALPGFGDDATPGSSLRLRSGEFDGPHLAMQVGGRLDPVADSDQPHATARLDDSAVAVDAFGIQAQAWAHRSWWGPGWQSALPLSNNSPPLDGIGFQRAAALPSESPWLSWLGPWNMDFFLARTEGEPPAPGSNPLLSGWRLTARPLPLVEIGVTRMVQFGGTGHPETLGSFARAVVGSHANAQTVAAQSRDSGNGLAGGDLRIRCPFGVRCAVYTQIMGEDDRKHLPYKYMEVLGTEVWSADSATRLYFEATEVGCRDTWRKPTTAACAYLNYAYQNGFTNGNRWLGASVGSDGKMLALGWIDSDWDSVVRLAYAHVGSHVGTFGPPLANVAPGRPLWALSARRTWHFGSTSVTPEFDWTRLEWIDGVRVSPRASLEVSTTLDDLGLASPRRFADALAAAGSNPTTTRLLAATALIGGAALFDRATGSYAQEHHNEPALKVLRQGGSALPYAEFGLAGAAWLARRGSPDGDVALASVEAGLTSVAMAEAIKMAVERSRPREGRGAADFGHEKRSDSSFPSESTALAWAVLTPVAQRYDAPWLYGVAALTNVGRIAGRNHWLSDTVAGSVLGYVVGDWFGKRADAGGTGTTVMLVPHGAVLSTTFR
jgi:membrane-associated phospholipid phosphatase